MSSDLIRLAVGHTAFLFGNLPADGFVTFVDGSKVRHKRDPGRCFLKAGWLRDGFTKSGLVKLRLPIDRIAPIEILLPLQIAMKEKENA